MTSRLSPFRAHSHITATRHPCSRSFLILRLSRSTFPRNLRSQNSVLLAGVVAYLHPGWRCQKQPCTKTTALYLGNTRSGCPGSFRSCNLYRKPSLCNALRSAISGRVFLPLMEAIILERVSLSTISAMTSDLANHACQCDLLCVPLVQAGA